MDYSRGLPGTRMTLQCPNECRSPLFTALGTQSRSVIVDENRGYVEEATNDPGHLELEGPYLCTQCGKEAIWNELADASAKD